MLSPSERETLAGMPAFCFEEFYRICQNNGCSLGEAGMRKRLQRLLKDEVIARVGWNVYCIPQNGIGQYFHAYSDEAAHIAQIITDSFPSVEFAIFELRQLNEFVNHLLPRNVLFLSVENEVSEFVFETMKSHFPGRVLLTPTLENYHRYWYDGMIVINRLITEAPKDRNTRWHTPIEKLLVDLVADPLLRSSVSESEYPLIFENAFARYIINKSRLLRYAKRRSTESQIDDFITKL